RPTGITVAYSLAPPFRRLQHRRQCHVKKTDTRQLGVLHVINFEKYTAVEKTPCPSRAKDCISGPATFRGIYAPDLRRRAAPSRRTKVCYKNNCHQGFTDLLRPTFKQLIGCIADV